MVMWLLARWWRWIIPSEVWSVIRILRRTDWTAPDPES